MDKNIFVKALTPPHLTFLGNTKDEYKDVPTSVITADFYNASALLPLSDDAIVARVKAHLETCEPQVFKGEQGPLV